MTLEAHALTKAYRTLVALHELSFVAGAGEVIGLLGPNGAGKTTAIRLLTTILAPSGGRFAVAGIPHSRPTEIRRRIGVLPESAGYPDRQTGAEFLRYHARLYGHPAPSARVTAAALLEEVGLAERGGSPIANYSRGMRQRLGIARALLNDPAVVFLAVSRERAATVILSTHLLAEVEEVCSRVLILNRGRLVADGTVAEVARQAAAPRRGRFRVPAEARDGAVLALAAIPDLGGVRSDDGRAGWLVVDAPDVDVQGATAALGAAGIPVLAFELEGARLSDAYLAMTEAG
jgi:ABC-2 type transport system ATP-binding protein